MEKQRFTDDMWQDIIVTKKSYDSTNKGKVLNGYIQIISRYPLKKYIQSTPINKVTSVRGHFDPIKRRTLLTENILY